MKQLLISGFAAVLLVTACGGEPAADKAAPAAEHADEAGGEAHAEGEEKEGGAHAEGESEGPPSTKIPAQRAASAGVRTEKVSGGTIGDQHEVQGLLTPVEGSIAKVMARFPGPIRALRANVGDRVSAGQPLATIESNLSLTNYTVSAPISGVVLAREASVGAVAGEGMALYEIANLGDMWVDLHIFGRDAQHVRPGNAVVVTRMSDGVTEETRIERILPSTATASQSTVARARVRNQDGMWRPGSAVKARITVDEQAAALTVPLTAVQSTGEEDVVYVVTGETYTQRAVQLGKRDARQVEVLSGLRAGETVVTAKSFLIKADIAKATAEHGH